MDKAAGTITASGTATADAQFDFQGSSPKSVSTIKNGLIYSCEGTSSNLVCSISYYNSLGAWISEQRATTSGTIISIPSNANSYKFWVRKRPAAESETFIFKPMLRDGDIIDDSFEPYQEPTDSLIETKARTYLNSTVGHSSKNLLNLKNLSSVTRNGVTWTVDPVAGTITANGTATAQSQYEDVRFTLSKGNYYFSGCPSGGDTSTYDLYAWDYTTKSRPKEWDGSTKAPSDFDGTKKQFQVVNNHKYGLTCRVQPGVTVNNLVFKLMVWDGSISDDTFEPYQEPTDSLIETKARAYLTSTVGHTCKNYISYDTSTYTYTANGITFTLDPSAGTVTANGTATANTELRIPFNHITTISGNVVYTKKPIKSGKYYFCGSPSGGTSTSYWCFVYDNTTGSGAKKWNGTSGISRDYGDVHKNEVLIDDTHSQRFTILIANGYTASNVVFRPMIWSGDIDDDTFEPYQEPTDSLIETKARAYLNSTVGHACKNLFDLSKYTYGSGISNVIIDAATGSLSYTGTGIHISVSFYAADLGVEMYGKTYTVSCINNLASTVDGRLAIRKADTNQIVTRVGFNSTGKKSITFTPDVETFPNGWYISVLATGSKSTTGKIDVSNLMLREASISDDTFEPYVTPTDEAKQDKPVVLYDAGESSMGAVAITHMSNLTQYSELHITLFSPKDKDDISKGGFTRTIVHSFILPDNSWLQEDRFDYWITEYVDGKKIQKRVGMSLRAYTFNTIGAVEILGEINE